MDHLYLTDDTGKSAALANLLLLLSIGLSSPTKELAQGLCDGSFFSDYISCQNELFPTDILYAADAYFGRDVESVYHEINVEYTRLFLSPKRELVPLYESVLVHPGEKVSMFINPTVMHCEQVYRKTGFSFEEKNKFPGDHVGIELRYYACLLARRAMALDEGNTSDAEASATVLSEFAAQHIARWITPFAAKVAMHTQVPFYTALADTLSQLAPHLK